MRVLGEGGGQEERGDRRKGRDQDVLGKVDVVAGSTAHDLGVGDNATAVSGGEGGGTGLAVPGHVALPGCAAHRQRVDAIGVAVTVAVVIVQATIA